MSESDSAVGEYMREVAHRRANALGSVERVGDAFGALAGWTVEIKDIIDARELPLLL